MTSEELVKLEGMIRSKNIDDLILAVEIIWNNKPFPNYTKLLSSAKFNIGRLTMVNGWYYNYQNLSYTAFYNKIMNKKELHQKLYKLDSDKRERILHIYTDGADLVQESGLVNGQLVTHRKTCKGKNIGKSNETTPEEQAKSEARSKIAEKLKEGYFKTLKEAKNTEVVLPMLAKSYDEEKHKIDWTNCYVQRKYDGQRCLAYKKDGRVVLMSRKGTEIENMDHIKEALSDLKDNVILDGELYSLELGSFQNQMKAIKKYTPGISEKVQYHIYDVVSKDPFHKRMVFTKVFNEPLVKVETFKILDEKELKYYHKKFVSEGYEGSIVRWGNAEYKIDGRSENLLKYKDFQDIALKIHDVISAEQRPNWGQFVFYWKGAKGHPYGDDYIGCGMKFSHEDREEFLKNKKEYIGKTAELRYFEKSDEGVLRFPVCVGIRLDK